MSKVRRTPRASIRRLDGARHWERTLSQYVTLLQVAQVSPARILRVTKASLKKNRKIRTLKIPTVESMQYPRVLTHWQVEPKYLDEHAAPRELVLKGTKVSFATLVREALPGSIPADVLRVLESHRLVKRTPENRIAMLAGAFVPPGEQLGHSLAYTLSAVEGIVATGHSNMMRRDPKHRVGRMQRMVFAEHFDFAYLPDYDRYVHESAETMLKKHDAWLKRREVKGNRRKRKAGYAGVIISAIRAR